MNSEQSENIRKQLIEQIESTFPEDKKILAIEQINSMDDSQLEEFLIKNNLITSKSSEISEKTKEITCIFCSIIAGKIPSYKLDENKTSLAILEINPISKGHSLIIPKLHLSTSGKLPSQIFSLAKKLSKKIKSKLKPKEVKISSSNLMGHEFLNILPIYKDETLESEKHPAKKEELEALKKTLETKPRKKAIKKIKPKKEEILPKFNLPKRIP